jgi:hypothetical protein
MTTHRVLLDAADLVARGWCQGHDAETASGAVVDALHTDAVRWCLYASVRMAVRGNEGAYDQAARVLRADRGPLWNWNDAPERTQADVVAALREAATRAA